jgi:hypothetical protein
MKPMPAGFTSFYMYAFEGNKCFYRRNLASDEEEVHEFFPESALPKVRAALLDEVFNLPASATLEQICRAAPSGLDIVPPRQLSDTKLQSLAKKLEMIPKKYLFYYPKVLANVKEPGIVPQDVSMNLEKETEISLEEMNLEKDPEKEKDDMDLEIENSKHPIQPKTNPAKKLQKSLMSYMGMASVSSNHVSLCDIEQQPTDGNATQKKRKYVKSGIYCKKKKIANSSNEVKK